MKKENANNRLSYNLFRGCLALALLFTQLHLRADEGMWIPLLIEKYHIGMMKEAGLKLEAEDIYSINQDCLKDAVVIFGGGCTGEMISSQGLLLTNHHCGEGQIQSHSSVEHDYLSNGFWAMSREEELPNKGLTVTFLRYMEDVTDRIMEGIEQGMDPQEIQNIMDDNRTEITRKATEGTHYDASVREFYYGNEFYLFVSERFTDVRLVGAPPVSVGNFGGDLDNWVWPRHTGDFSLFRVYADEENNPSEFSPSNRPYKPKKHLEINISGLEEGDYTMILGNPGRTEQYLYSAAVEELLENSYPRMIELRTTRLDIMGKYMKTSDKVRIQYAHKFRRVSNAWKKWQGVILGLNRNHILELKKQNEAAFGEWVDADGERQMKYDNLLDDFAALYKELGTYELAMDMLYESVYAVELFRFSMTLGGMMYRGLPADVIKNRVESFFKDYYLPVDQETFARMMEAYYELMPREHQPAFLKKAASKGDGNLDAFAEKVFQKSVFGDETKVDQLIDLYEKKKTKAIQKLEKDPISKYMDQFRTIYLVGISPEHRRLEDKEARLYKSYMAALMEQAGDRMLFPDANGTMRLTFGKVEGYEPADGVEYEYYTTLSGVIEKVKSGEENYKVPDRLRELYESKDYGPYGYDGTMPVCFVASNHTSGGNSGSPVLDAYGRLIGINFDREWEGVMSDIKFDPELCRNIAVDIRYVLFIIDKFAGAGYLVEEMDLVTEREIVIESASAE